MKTLVFSLLFLLQIDFYLPVSSNYAIAKSSEGIEMIDVEGGKFIMGCPLKTSQCEPDELPLNEVSLSSYKIGKYEVTQAQWKAIMGNRPSFKKNCDKCPVEYVSWEEVQQFINKLNAKTGKSYRLPTEAEWEFAARGGNKTKSFLFSGSNQHEDVAWFEKNSADEVQKVGLKMPNELGIYDMSGNVGEFCSDWYADNYSPETKINPQGPQEGTKRVFRGGSCYTEPLKVWFRHSYGGSHKRSDCGFRLAHSGS
jgi:formylglycine-generating enzyme required for sulfatase activity